MTGRFQAPRGRRHRWAKLKGSRSPRGVGLVRHRGPTPRTFTAWDTAETDASIVEHTLIATNEQAALLQRQLKRLPCVVDVKTLTTNHHHDP